MAADPAQSEFSREFEALRPLLACPACYGELQFDADQVLCQGCARAYAVLDGIPVLIASQGESGT